MILVSFREYGLTWDEEDQRNYGEAVLRWYGSAFRDRSALSYLNLYLYGGFFEVVAQLVTRLSPLGVYETRHLVNAAFGLVAIATTYRLGAFVSNQMGGFFSALFLTVTPVFYGHLFNNSKDIPFLTMSLLAFYFILRSYDLLPRLPRSHSATIGITVGLAMGIRAGGVILLGYLGLLWALWLAVHWKINRTRTNSDAHEEEPDAARAANGASPINAATHRLNGKTIARLIISFALIALIAWLVMLVWWPWAQTKPLINPFRGLSQTARFASTVRVFYDGRFIDSTGLPRSYLPTWFVITLPEFYFVTLLAGLFLMWRFVRRSWPTIERSDKLVKVGMLVFGFGFPPLVAIALHSTLYNGLRHFLFVVPFLAVLAGISFATLLESGVSRWAKAGVAALTVLSSASTIVDMFQLHPYQYIYFNRSIAGGLKNAAQRYETDYWGMSYKEGAEWVIENYHPEAKDPIRVANCSTPFLTAYFLEKTEDARRRFITVSRSEDPNLFLAIGKCHRKKNRHIIHTVQRQGTPLMHVIELREPE